MQVDTSPALSAAPAADRSDRSVRSSQSIRSIRSNQSNQSNQLNGSNRSNQSNQYNGSNRSNQSNQLNGSNRSNRSNPSNRSNQLDTSNRSNASNRSNQLDTSNRSNPSNPSNPTIQLNQLHQLDMSNLLGVSNRSNASASVDQMYIPSLNGDSEEKYNRFLATNNNEYTVDEMKRFLKEGITKSGLRMLDTNHCEWYYDYYQATKTSEPPLAELTPGTTVDYYYYTTPFQTQIGTINLVMMNSQVNFEDGTFAPSDRCFKNNQITDDMIIRAREAAKKYQK